MRMLSLLKVAPLLLTTGLLFAPPTIAGQTDHAGLQGAWEARQYQLATGEHYPVRGRIIFTPDEWQVLFFVMDGEEARRGSGEGGRYTFEGGKLTFEHLFHLSAGEEMSGLPASPLSLTARAGDGPLEPTDIEIAGDRLMLHFPSGNTMTFVRGSS